jgi:excisionase family DNA binding protein
MEPETTGVASQPESLLTRRELAAALKVSLRTVDQMLADEEITPVRLRGTLVRFCLPDVMRELRARATTSKRAVARRV